MDMQKTSQIVRPSPTLEGQRGLAGIKSLDVSFRKGVSKEDQDAALDYLNRLIEWCALPGVTVPIPGGFGSSRGNIA